MRSRLLAMGLMSMSLAACAAPAPAAELRFAEIDGRREAYAVEGQGAPAIVMITGLGNDMSTFDKVAAALSADTTVVRIDRPGYGKSTPVDAPRDLAVVAADLHEVIRQAGVKAPYVMLGHSLGGMYAEYYASVYRDEVAGLVLDESRAADFSARCLNRLGPDKCLPPAMLLKLLPAVMRQEFASVGQVSTALGAAKVDPSLPVLVLTRGKPGQEGKDFYALWLETQDDMAAKYHGARHVTAQGAGHYVHKDAEALFLENVRDFLASLRR